MMVPLPPPDTRPAPPAGVRLDVRVGGGRAVAYPLGDEFLVGGAAGCDLRIPGANVPPVVCQFTATDDTVRVRRTSPGVPVSINDVPLAGTTALADGDRVTAGPVELVLRLPAAAYLSPKLVPFTPPPVDPPALDPAAVDRRIDAVRADLSRLEDHKARLEGEQLVARREIDRERADLAGVRQSLFHEFAQRQAQLTAMTEAAARAEAEFTARREELEANARARQTDIERAQADRLRELNDEIARRRLEFEDDVRAADPRLAEMRTERERLDAQRTALDELRSKLDADRRSFDADIGWQRDHVGDRERALDEREAGLFHREEQLRAERAALLAERDEFKDDLARLDRQRAAVESRQRELEVRAAEVDGRLDALRRDSTELASHVQLAEAERRGAQAEAARAAEAKAALDVQAARLAERAEQLEAQQATLAVLRAKLDRQQDDMREEAARLAVERLKQDEARADLAAKLADAERARAELGAMRDDHDARRQAFDERNSLLAATLEEIQRQKDELASAEGRLAAREQELDSRTAETAEQAAVLKARLAQVGELHERVEADRRAVKDREGLLTESDAARLAFQEQLRRRADELAARAKEFDEINRQLADERAEFDRRRAELDAERSHAGERLAGDRRDLDSTAADLQAQTAALADREAALARQVARLREVGAAVAAERKGLFEARQQWEADRAAAAEREVESRRHSEAFHGQLDAHLAHLRSEAPDLERGAAAAMDKLAAARDVLRGHLSELHEYATQTRQELDVARAAVRDDADRLRGQADDLGRARDEHRLAVAGFRQQLLDWQTKITELRQGMSESESRIGQREAELDAAAREVVAARDELAGKLASAERERRTAADQRAEMERHLGDMREWYRRKLRELAAGRPVDDSDMPRLAAGSDRQPAAPQPAPVAESGSPAAEEPDPADKQLGELLRSRGLVDGGTLSALWTEARRQGRSLRQTLLASGAVTLYQLALIEAGNLDGLALGRLRVVDQVRSGGKESVYRVFDPARPGGPTRGIYVLRHLGKSEAADAVRPDEFRQRFAAAAAAAHPHLANTLEVLDIGGRPAAVQEWVTGVGSADWPPVAATPGVWVRLVTAAAEAVAHAHQHGLVHGRLTADAFVLSADGTLKLLGLGDPPWLHPTPAADAASADLRALGQVAFGWSQLGSRRKGARAKPFPADLTAVVRRLEIGADPPMGDVVAIDRPYADAADLLRDLARLAREHPCPAGEWDKLVRFASENAPTSGAAPLRQTA